MTKRLLFAHDHRFYSDGENGFYSSGGLPVSAWDRYLRVFNSVTVLARAGGELDKVAIKNMALSSRANVSFELSQGLSGIRSKLQSDKILSKRIAMLVSTHDACVVRLGSEIGLAVAREANKQGKPYAVELVECSWDAFWSYGSVLAKLYAPVMYYRVRKAVRNAPMVLYVTESFLQRRYPTKASITVACSNVQIPRMTEDTLIARLRKIDSHKGRIRFGIIGSLNGRLKGFDVAFKAMSSVSGVLPNFELRILGGGDAAPWHKLAMEEAPGISIEFDGMRPAGQPVYDWLDEIDIYLHPSYKEGLPRALIEAMSRGCPAIASSVAGTPELLEEGELIKAGDSQSLAEILKDIALDKKSLKVMAIRNFEVAKKYQSSYLEEKRYGFYKNLLAPGSLGKGHMETR